MNSINTQGQPDYPFDREGLEFLQQMVLSVSKLATLGGSNYILSGCAVKDGIAEKGMIVIGGELLPFTGGEVKTAITIKETRATITAFGKEYPEAEITRFAEFSNTGDAWSDFKQVLSNAELQTKIEEIKGDPPSFVKSWSGRLDRIPDNYMLADGRLLKTIDYPDLAYYYGKEYEESFNLPDLRHRFIVGYDSTKQDYDSIGKTGGSEFVKNELENIPKHVHAYTDDTNAQGKYPQIEDGFPISITGVSAVKSSAESTGWGTAYNTGSTGGDKNDGTTVPHENRPPYYVLAYVIKVKY